MVKKWTNETIDNNLTSNIKRITDVTTISAPSITKLLWKCNKHHTWLTTWDSIRRGSRCPHCAGNIPFTVKTLQLQLEKEHRSFSVIELYNRDINHERRGKFKCKLCNKTWLAILSNILGKKQNCPACGKTGRYNETYFQKRPEENGLFYVLLFEGTKETFIKIGITKRSISARYQQSIYPYKITPIKIINTTLYNAWKLEQSIIQKFINYRYQTKNKFGGKNECFKISFKHKILQFIKGNINDTSECTNNI